MSESPPSPSRITAIDLRGDGVLERFTLHEAEGLIHTPALFDGKFTLELPARLLVSGDADGDGCADLIVASQHGVQAVRSTVCPGVPLSRHPSAPRSATSAPATGSGEPPGTGLTPERTKPEVARVEPTQIWRPPTTRRRWLGVALPDLLGPGAVSPGERSGHQSHLVLGYGWVVGGSLLPTAIQIPAFPTLSFAYESGSPRARWFAGIDSAGLFFWVGDDFGGIHLLNGTFGLAAGSPRLRAGPFVTAGIWNAGAGLRLVATPWREHRNLYRGFEARLTWFYPSVGQVSVQYTLSEARGQPDKLKPGAAQPDTARAGLGACAQVELMFGAVVGGSSTASSWEYVGSSVPVEFRGSPALAVGCDTGRRGGLFIGVETAPIFGFLTPDDARRFHMGSWTVGPMAGGGRVRGGPIGTVGIWALGAGGRLAVDVATGDHGVRHRVEARAVALAFSAPAAEAWLMYGVAYDPRR